MSRFLIIGIYSLLTLCFTRSGDLVKESFSYPDGPLPGHFWSEGCTAVIKNKRLLIDADTTGQRASTIWLDKELSGNVSIEFDVYLLSSADDANNVNVFLMYNDPSGRLLRQTADSRQDGLYRRYHTLNGYIFTNVTNGDTASVRYRFRKNPGFKLVSENFRPGAGRGRKLHVKLVKKAGHFEYWENGKKILDAVDTAEAYNKGFFGFRTWHTAMEIDNLLIKRI
jgi:hypothetical protein